MLAFHPNAGGFTCKQGRYSGLGCQEQHEVSLIYVANAIKRKRGCAPHNALPHTHRRSAKGPGVVTWIQRGFTLLMRWPPVLGTQQWRSTWWTSSAIGARHAITGRHACAFDFAGMLLLMKPYPTTVISNHAFTSVALQTLAKTYSIGNINAAAGRGAPIAKGGHAAAHAYAQA